MYTAAEFQVKEEPAAGSACVIAVRGALDLYTSPSVRTRIRDLIDSGTREIVVDLSETTFLDSSALGVLVGALKRLRLRPDGGRLLVVSGSPRLARTLALTGLDQVLEVYSTRDHALEALA
jgi:anti-sigma B factor antagonist